MAFFHKGYEDLGVEALSAYLKANGHEVDLYYDGSAFSSNIGLDNPLLSRLFDINAREFERRVEQRLRERPPDLVGLTGCTINYQWSLGWAKWIKQRLDVPVVYGGPHATAAPEGVIAQDCVDAVVRGEGEGALLDLLESLEGGRFPDHSIRNVWFKRGGEVIKNPVRPYIRDLDSLPFPDKDIFNDKIDVFYWRYMTISSRGCPFRCSYCTNSVYHRIYSEEKNHVRRRSPENVVEEIARARDGHHVHFVFFWDDIFTTQPEWLESFAEIYSSRIGTPFFCYAHPGTVNPRVVAALRAAGCEQVTMGVQSFHREVREHMLGRHHSDERIYESGRLIKQAGIKLFTDNLMLLPGESEEMVEESVRKYIRLGPDFISNYSLVYFPGSAIVDQCRDEGVITEEERQAIHRGERPGDIGFADVENRRSNLTKLKYQYYLDLIPLLPAGWVGWMLERRLLHKLPFMYILRQLLILVTDLKNKNVRGRYMLRYALAKKSLP